MTLFDAILSPLGFGLVLVTGLSLLRHRLPRWMFATGVATLMVCLLLATPLGADTLLAIEEARAPHAAECPTPVPTEVVLLAAGMRRDSTEPDDIGALNDASVQRTLQTTELVQRLAGAQLVISGGAHRHAIVSARMAELAVRLGVPRSSIRTEEASLTTWQNAMRVRALEPALPARIWLATSAAHMPRALIAFRAAGFEPCAYPVDFRSSAFAGPADLLPGGGAVARSESVLHELVGEVVYRWRASRSSAQAR